MSKATKDPGCSPEEGPSNIPPQNTHELQEMKDQFEQQQNLISQLKEIMKKTDQRSTTVTQEKVAEYANTLTKMKSRAKRHSLAKAKEGESEVAKVCTPASEKVLLLRQQLEQNKAKLAERGKNQKGIEEMVAQVKAQLDDSQHQINLSQTPLNISLIADRVDYSPLLSSQELYNILLNKDKLINEMNGKVNKLQVNVLDLQENIKEKDSVIDARTKAITLMSDNLSKKSKTTLDALEDTKEQMRKMQETFIEVEEQLKAENTTLKNDLSNKSVEIQRLNAENEVLTLKNSELQATETFLRAQVAEFENVKPSRNQSPSRRSLSKNRKSKKGKFPSKVDASKEDISINELELKLSQTLIDLEAKTAEIEEMKKTHQGRIYEHEKTIEDIQAKHVELEKLVEELQTKETAVKIAGVAAVVLDNEEIENPELTKLKQQLDEANKNMIKVKAEHKKKLKEMTKKMDAFKKVSDANAELVKIEAENSRLQMKIAELEKKKGQMQGMVESRESTSTDELDATIKDLKSRLDDNEITINNHVSENAKYQEELHCLRRKLEQMTSDEVQQKLSTVQFEEQYETLEKEKSALQTTIEMLEQQIQEINVQLETTKKEKLEIQQKYDGLLQENADLVDRLEKLSTEKVSSAESIEIVENLTQQEKLELEAYQKSLLPKNSMDNLEENVDLNDSVNQLTEETSELLQKIELFTIERREVMEKLELLTEENNQLSLNLKEVENNRDVLVETYEQLQTEKEVLDNKLEDFETQIAQLKKRDNTSNDSVEIEEYKSLLQVQRQEIGDLQLKLLSYETHDYHKNEWEGKYKKATAENEKLLAKLNEFKESAQNYEDIIEENKQELIKYAELLKTNSQLNNDHAAVIIQLEKLRQAETLAKDNQQQIKSQLQRLNEMVAELEKDLCDKCGIIGDLETKIHNLQEEKVKAESNLAQKLTEVEAVLYEKEQKEIENEKLLKSVQQITETDIQVQWQGKVQELQAKNKEQLEKMKKIAANLKKKTLDYKELEAKFTDLTSQTSELKQEDSRSKEELSALKATTSAELQNLTHEFSLKTEALMAEQRCLQQENSQIKTRNEEITTQLHTYSAQIEDLQNIIREYESQLNSLDREIDTLQSSYSGEEKATVIFRLNEEIEALKYNSETSNNALQMKIHEQEMCIEGQEQELQKFKENMSTLEESLSEVEVRRQSLEEMTFVLRNKLEIKENSIIEAAEREQQQENRIQALIERNGVNEDKFIEAQKENRNLTTDNNKLTSEVESYKQQLSKLNEQIKGNEEKKELLSTMEAAQERMKLKCKNLENELKKVSSDWTTLQNDSERNETELQQQLEYYAHEKKQLIEQVEIKQEKVYQLMEAGNEYQRTIADLNQKLDQQQIEFEDTINKYHELQQEHKKILSQLEDYEKAIQSRDTRIEELISKEIETPEYLQQLLLQKEKELDNYKRNYVPSPADFFSENVVEVNLNKEIQNLRQKLSIHSEKISKDANDGKIHELEEELQQRVESLKINEDMLKKLQDKLTLKEDQLKQSEGLVVEGTAQIELIKKAMKEIEATNFSTLSRNNELEQQIQVLQEERSKFAERMEYLLMLDELWQIEKMRSAPSDDDPLACIQSLDESPLIKREDFIKGLEQKIKTLENMLYNAEQEKEIAQNQCAQLSEERRRFVHEREQQQFTESTTQTNLESQIVDDEEISLPPRIPFESSRDPEQCTSSTNIIEDGCMQKRVYECTPANQSAFADDDGWGFEVEEVKMEETHQVASMWGNSNMIGELEERIRLLNLERDVHLEEIRQANVKAGKLIRKLKEFKARNEQLVAKIKAKSFDDFGLEDAIQDELKGQIQSLEKKLKEAESELFKEKAERENMIKRVDLLTAANERMVEMKEKQDIEVLGYQQQARDLQLKLEKVAWSSDFSDQVVSTSSNTSMSVTSLSLDDPGKQIQELKDLRESLKELTLDNEELQAMLEEQTRLRKEAEGKAKSVSLEPIDQTQLQIVLDEKAQLLLQLTVLEGDKNNMLAELDNAKSALSLICKERDKTELELKKLGDTLQENYKEKTLLEASLLENGILIESLRKTIDELQADIETLRGTGEHDDNAKQLMTEEVALLQLQIKNAIDERQQAIDRSKSLDSTLIELQTHLQEKTTEINRLQSSIDDKQLLLQEVGALKDQLKEIDGLKQQYVNQGVEYDKKLQITTEQLALEWAQHVEQRGNDVAESWKLHVETRENEFSQLEQALRKEVYDMEEKCNALVNENNELRRNVDAEIRNEVDRISSLQQHVNSLAESLQEKEADLVRLKEENGGLNKQLNEYESTINTSSEELAILLQRQDEKDKLIEELSAKLQEVSGDNKASTEVMEALRVQLVEKDNEIVKCKKMIDELLAAQDVEQITKLKTQIKENELQIAELTKEKEKYEKIKQKLQESTFQAMTLQATLQEKEHRLQELESYLQQHQSEESGSKMQLQTHVQELQQQIAQYMMQLQENNLHIGSLNDEIESYKVLNNHLQTKDTEIQRLSNLLEERSREHEYALENQLLESQSVLFTRTQEYDALRRLLNQTEIARDELVLSKDAEIETYVEQLAACNKQLGECQVEYGSVQSKLVEVTGRVVWYEEQIGGYQQQISEYERQMAELNAIIEGQVLKIEELQQDVYEKSRNYDALVAQMENTEELQKKVRFAVSASSTDITTASSGGSKESIEKDDFDAAARAELDLALYMLHQRDVRCEELTVELMQLLEERDTLQLRLSNALRENETIRATTVPTPSEVLVPNEVVSVAPLQNVVQGSSSENVSSLVQQDGHGGLANKLTELKIVGYKKDKTLVDEQELRRLQQMAFLQQHKGDVSRLPAEAQARLRDANYTLSRDVQSPSKVLLNWLWGTSTPKVNNT